MLYERINAKLKKKERKSCNILASVESNVCVEFCELFLPTSGRIETSYVYEYMKRS